MKYAITFFLSILSLSSNGQTQYKNGVSVNISYGVSGNHQDVPFYNFQFASDQIEVDEKYTVRSRNYTFDYSRFIFPRHGLKASFGMANYGFGIKGELINAIAQFNNTYTIRYLEWGLSYIYRHPLKNQSNLIFEPGLRYHTDGSFRSNGISIRTAQAYSLSIFAGVEFPLTNNNFFTNIGILFKAPTQSYSNSLLETPNFYPYFIGLKLGISYQFEFFKKA